MEQNINMVLLEILIISSFLLLGLSLGMFFSCIGPHKNWCQLCNRYFEKYHIKLPCGHMFHKKCIICHNISLFGHHSTQKYICCSFCSKKHKAKTTVKFLDDLLCLENELLISE
jgi:hypothetical protein